MIWNEVIIHTNSLGVDVLADLLVSLGVVCFVTEDPNEFREFLDDKTVPWDYVDENLMALAEGESRQKIYLSDSEQDTILIENIKNAVAELKASRSDLGRLAVTISKVDDADWADNWKQYFKPLEIGDNIVIKPTWEDYDGDRTTILELDPGSSFGTGQHETTALCLELVERYMASHPNANVLDMGCGSGILGIAALALGAKSVFAIDIDENAVNIAIENAQKNGYSDDVFKAVCGNVNENKYLAAKVCSLGCDIVLANIVADVIIMMAPVLAASLQAGKTLIVSGIIAPKKDKVLQTLKDSGFKLTQIHEKNDWVAASLLKL